LPTIWLDRQLGESQFDLGRFLPGYLRWYFYAYGPKLTREQIAARRRDRDEPPLPVSGPAPADAQVAPDAGAPRSNVGQ
jgi:hypothetical protein